MNELIEYLLNYTFDHGIGYKLVHADPYDPSLSLKKHNLIVINLNWHNKSELPFIIGHELGHLILGHKREEFDESPAKRIRMEKEANEFSLNLLTEYCDLHEICFYNKYSFAHAFGIPKNCYYLLEEQA